MGYHTVFNLSLGDVSKDTKEAVVNALKDKGIIGYALDYNLDYYDAVNWYGHDLDMIEVSRLFPDVLFELDGKGEENEDIWITYYKNGKMQHCNAIITFEPFDENKLR